MRKMNLFFDWELLVAPEKSDPRLLLKEVQGLQGCYLEGNLLQIPVYHRNQNEYTNTQYKTKFRSNSSIFCNHYKHSAFRD